MFNEFVFRLFCQTILVGFLFGLVHFIVVNPIRYNSDVNYVRNIGYNFLFILVVLPIGFALSSILFDESFPSGRLNTNYVYSTFLFVICILTSLIFFGFFKFENYGDRVVEALPSLSPIAFLFDLNLYWFFLNAYLISSFAVGHFSWLSLVALGFVFALSISNLKNHLR